MVLDLDGGRVRVKRARRPGGARTAKAEAVDLGNARADLAGRQRLRRDAEARALGEGTPVDDG